MLRMRSVASFVKQMRVGFLRLPPELNAPRPSSLMPEVSLSVFPMRFYGSDRPPLTTAQWRRINDKKDGKKEHQIKKKANKAEARREATIEAYHQELEEERKRNEDIYSGILLRSISSLTTKEEMLFITNVLSEISLNMADARVILYNIALPNLLDVKEDKELLEKDEMGYIFCNSRRRVASKLIRKMCTKKRRIVELVELEVKRLLTFPHWEWENHLRVYSLVMSLLDAKDEFALNLIKKVALKELANHSPQCPFFETVALELISEFVEVIPPVLLADILPHLQKGLEAKSRLWSTYSTLSMTKILLKAKHGSFRVNPALLLNNTLEFLYFTRTAKRNDFTVYLVGGALRALVREVCKQHEPSMLLFLESRIFPVIEELLNDCLTCETLLPSLCDLVTQLIQVQRSTLSVKYVDIVYSLVSADAWLKANDAAALVRLVQALLLNNPQEFRWSMVFRMLTGLVSSPKAVGDGVNGLKLLVGTGTLSYRDISPFMSEMWAAVNTVVGTQKILLLSLFVVKHGVDPLITDLNAVRGTNFKSVLVKWIPDLKLVKEEYDVKLAVVAGTRVICHPRVFEYESSHERWGSFVENILVLLIKKQKKGDSEDLIPEVEDPKLFLVTSLSKLTEDHPAKYLNMFAKHVNRGLVAELQKLCDDYNVNLELPPVETKGKKKKK